MDIINGKINTMTEEVKGRVSERAFTIPTGLENLKDVELTNPVEGEALVYNGEKWVNGAGGDLTELKMLGYTVPKECPIQNSVSGNQFIQRVGRVDLGSLSWSYYGVYFGHNLFYADNLIGKIYLNEDEVFIYSSKYVGVPNNRASYMNNNEMRVRTNDGRLYINDDSTSNATDFKNNNKGVYLYYRLPNPITMNIDGNEIVANALEWKNSVNGVELKSTGNAYITLPTDFNELLVIVKHGTDSMVKHSISIPKLALSNTDSGFIIGSYYYGGSGLQIYGRVVANYERLRLQEYYKEGGNKTSECTTYVYYK